MLFVVAVCCGLLRLCCQAVPGCYSIFKQVWWSWCFGIMKIIIMMVLQDLKLLVVMLNFVFIVIYVGKAFASGLALTLGCCCSSWP